MDVVLVGFVAGWVAGGWRSGFLRRLIGLAFAGISLVASAYFRYPVGAIASTFFKGIPTEYANMVGYTIAFPVILAGLHLARRTLIRNVAVSGLTKETDQALGAVFGGAEAIVMLSAAVVILDYFGTSASTGGAMGPGFLKDLAVSMNASTTVQLLRDTSVPVVLTVLGPLLPKDIVALLSNSLPGGLLGGMPGGLPLLTPPHR